METWEYLVGLKLLPAPLHPAVILLGAALALLFATYVGYPLLTVLRARFKPTPLGGEPRWDDEAPTVTCVLAAHNEGPSLVAKVRNLLGLDYPADKLDVVVADDGSTDGSAEAAAALDPVRVRVVQVDERAGKANALTQAVPTTRGELLVFCDVRQRFDDRAVRELVRPFADPNVGAASGLLLLDGSRGPGAYWRYESMIRRAEGKLDSVIGVTGAIYAIRRHLFPQVLPPSLILDDVYVPMSLVLADYRVVHVPSAEAYDAELSMEDEFPRKVRTLAGNYQLVAMLPELLDPFRNRLFWAFFWHKLARLLCPFALLVALVASALAPGLLPLALFLGQLAVYGLALLGQLQGRRAGRLASICHAFVGLNLAAVMGLVQFAKGSKGTWKPTSQLARAPSREPG